MKKLIEEDWIDNKIRILRQILDNTKYDQGSRTSAHNRIIAYEAVKTQLQSPTEEIKKAFNAAREMQDWSDPSAGDVDFIYDEDTYLKQNGYE